MKKTQVQTVENILDGGGAMTNNAIAAMTDLNTQQVATGLNQLKHTGKVSKQLVSGGPALWSLTASPVKVKAKPAFKPAFKPLILLVGDLLEVAGRKTDGTVVVRTLEVPQTMYTIEEV